MQLNNTILVILLSKSTCSNGENWSEFEICQWNMRDVHVAATRVRCPAQEMLISLLRVHSTGYRDYWKLVKYKVAKREYYK
jgi:hypothetical protein